MHKYFGIFLGRYTIHNSFTKFLENSIEFVLRSGPSETIVPAPTIIPYFFQKVNR